MNIANLKKRVIFVLWAIPIAWWIVNSTFSILSLLPTSVTPKYVIDHNIIIYPGHLLAIIVIFLACFEYLQLLSGLYPKNGFWMIYIWLSLQILSYFIPDNLFKMRNDLYILLIFVSMEAFIWGKHTGRWKRASLLFSGTIFLVIACASMLDFYDKPFQNVFSPRFSHTMLSQLGIIIVLAAIFFCDSAAFFAGSLFGKHHFSSISPKKTIEGSVTGLLTSIIICTIAWHFLVDNSKYPLILGSVLGLLIGIFAQVGDLLVSLIKRYFEVKDSSNLIPGHGGILDRFDSLFFTSPIVHLFILIVDKVLT